MKGNKMTLIKWNPISNMSSFFDDFENMFSKAIMKPLEINDGTHFLTPSINVNETDDNYSIFIDLPGVEKKDIEVSMNDGQVVVLAERKSNIKTKSDKYAWQESMAGKYQRTIELPGVINEDNIKAKYNNGVLNLIIPKIEERKLETKKIAIN